MLRCRSRSAAFLRNCLTSSVVAPVIWQLTTTKNLEVIYGIDLKSFEALVPFHFLHGGPFQGPNDCLVDDFFAQSQHVKVGDTIEILNHPFRVAGIVEHGRGARKFLPMSTLQDLIGSAGKASVFYVKLDDPANADAVVQEVKSVQGLENLFGALHARISLHDDSQQLSRPVHVH